MKIDLKQVIFQYYFFINRSKFACMTFKGTFTSILYDQDESSIVCLYDLQTRIFLFFHKQIQVWLYELQTQIFLFSQGKNKRRYLLTQGSVRQFKYSCTLQPCFVPLSNVSIPPPNKKPSDKRNRKEWTSINLQILSFNHKDSRAKPFS